MSPIVHSTPWPRGRGHNPEHQLGNVRQKETTQLCTESWRPRIIRPDVAIAGSSPAGPFRDGGTLCPTRLSGRDTGRRRGRADFQHTETAASNPGLAPVQPGKPDPGPESGTGVSSVLKSRGTCAPLSAGTKAFAKRRCVTARCFHLQPVRACPPVQPTLASTRFSNSTGSKRRAPPRQHRTLRPRGVPSRPSYRAALRLQSAGSDRDAASRPPHAENGTRGLRPLTLQSLRTNIMPWPG